MKKLLFVVVVIFALCSLVAKEPNIGKTFQAPPFEPRDDVLLQEGFETGNLPTGWTQSYVNGVIDWDYQNGGHYGNPGSSHSGTYNAFFYYDDYSAYSTKLITPAINLSSVTDPELTFWLAMVDWVGDLDELYVYYKTSAGGSWTLLSSYITEYINWTEITLNLPNPTSTYYIAFEGVSGYGYGVCLDDVMVTGVTGTNNLIDEDFGGGTFPPTGWSVIGDGTTNWLSSNSSNAGGSSPEAEFSWTPSFVGTSYFTSPIVATSGQSYLYLDYCHMLNDYSGANYSIGVATTSNGGVTWHLVSEVFPIGDIGPETVSLTVNTPDVGSNNFQFAFFFNGDSFDLDYWYLDNVVLSTSTEAGNIVNLANALKGNYPNPFNPTTTIAFSVITPGPVSIDIYNIKGEKVKTLVKGEFDAKEYNVVWNGTDDNGKQVSSGVYFYKMISNNYSSTRKMIMLK
ncbi:MAG: choice-of-anchor J domain-containing protein [Candidatus Cloacimonadales bacterium]|nr:choice-of-anchor J domain-containing protein [Candidatus Cloacimonadales bacterium]